ncbi:MAG: MBL fold metallo-hydrolase [Hyphomonadaceae bacterium]
MQTQITEISANVFRLSTFIREVPPTGLAFNQFLIRGDEPLLFHTGMRALFPLVREAVAKLIAPEDLRWISFGHYEADECGAMNEWLALAPHAEIAHGMTGVGVSLMDQANRAPRALAHGDVLELGGKRARYLDTPHVPHGWEAGLMFEETSGTLLCGDLFTQYGDCAAATESDIVGAAIASEDIAGYSALNPGMGATLRSLAELKPRTLALMHGPAFTGDCASALNALADDYDRRVLARVRELALS